MNDQDLQLISSDDDSIDIKRYLSLFISNWYWFAIAIFISFTLAYGINRYSQKIYSVSASLLIKDDQNAGMSGMAASVIPGGDIFKSQQNLKNEIEILKSFNLNYLVMRNLPDFHVVYMGVGRRGIVESMLYKTSPFKVVYDSLELQHKNSKVLINIIDDNKFRIELDGIKDSEDILAFGTIYNKNGYSFRIEKRNPRKPITSSEWSNSYYFYFTEPARLANQYRSRLSVAPKDKDASVVALSISGFVPEQEADYLNKLMKVYIDDGLNLKNKIADSTISFINRQLAVISDSLKEAAIQLELFRTKNKFLDIKNLSSYAQNKLERTDFDKAEIELQLQYYNYLSEYLDINSGSPIISPSVIGINDQSLLRLISEYMVLKSEKEKMGFNLVENQPTIDYLNGQIEITRNSLKENVKNCIASLNVIKKEKERNIEINEKEVNKLPETEKLYVDIQRRFDLNNSIYTYLLEKRAESGIARASTLPDNRTIDYAQMKGLVKPNVKTNYIIALLLGLLIPGGAIALIDFFNDRVIDNKDVKKRTKVPVIGYISHSDVKNEIAVIEKPGSALAESFRSVRTAIKYYVKENEVAVIAISSTVSSEGKTFISINLAAITAMLGKRVLLIGLDLRKPRINKVFEFENSRGMSTYLSSNCEYEEIIKQTQIENLFYAPSGPIPPNPAELIETDRMKKFMERAKKEFDFIIIDTPPVAIVTDALLLAEYADVNLFIVRQRYTSCNTIEMIEQLKNHGELKNMAIVINDISLSGYYGYGMRYGYMRGYGYSYGTSYYGNGYYKKYSRNGKSEGYYTES